MCQRAYVFINYRQACGFGHVGWGFSIDDNRYYFGSTDHLWRAGSRYAASRWWKYMRVPPGEDVDWWATSGSREEMLTIMSAGPHIRYHAYKSCVVEKARIQAVIKAAGETCLGGWGILHNNCIHQTYGILNQYGAQLPYPRSGMSNFIPRLWFNAIPWTMQLSGLPLNRW